MKGKTSYKSRTKASLQKTSSTIINIPTHRHSIISDVVPFYYNDSLLSVRTSSLHHTNMRGQVSRERNQIRGQTQNSNAKPKKLIKQLSHQFTKQKSSKPVSGKQYGGISLKLKNKQKVKTLNSLRKQSKCKLSSNFSQTPFYQDEKHNYCSNKLPEKIQKSDFQILYQSTKNILNSYRLYTQQLNEAKNIYKQKYRETLKKLKKYQCK